MNRSSDQRSVLAALGALAAAEGAVRLLTPEELPAKAPAVAPQQVFTPAEIARGRAYARPQLLLGLAGSAAQLAAVSALARRPPRGLDTVRPAALGAAGLAAALSVALSGVTLPLGALSRRRALAAGLATQSWRDWARDLVKAQAIGGSFAAGAGAAVVWTMGRYPRTWWLRSAAGGVLAGSGLAALAPVLLDPLFNRFQPLAAGDVRDDVFALASAAGVRVREVYTVDASRRTTAANAYVTGLGPTKRVVLFDTLLDRYSRREVAVVVAHELAHVRGRDVARGVAYSALVAGPAALAVRTLAAPLQATEPRASSLPGLALAASAIGAPLSLIANRLSRRLERSADAFSLRLSADPDAFVAFERKITLQNVADPAPPAWLTAALATHPSTAQRIGMARSFAEQRAGGSLTPRPEGSRTPAGS